MNRTTSEVRFLIINLYITQYLDRKKTMQWLGDKIFEMPEELDSKIIAIEQIIDSLDKFNSDSDLEFVQKILNDLNTDYHRLKKDLTYIFYELKKTKNLFK